MQYLLSSDIQISPIFELCCWWGSYQPGTGARFRADSDYKWNPSCSYLVHISRIVRIVAKEVFFDQTFDRDEPEHPKPHQQCVEGTVGAKNERQVPQKNSCVDR